MAPPKILDVYLVELAVGFTHGGWTSFAVKIYVDPDYDSTTKEFSRMVFESGENALREILPKYNSQIKFMAPLTYRKLSLGELE